MTNKAVVVEKVARAIHESKLKTCYKWMGDNYLLREPWDKPNPASPNQPWHDIAIPQAIDAITAYESELKVENAKLWEMLALATRLFDRDEKFGVLKTAMEANGGGNG